MISKIKNETGRTKIWLWIVIGALFLVGVIYWDWAQHAKVEKFVAEAPDIPGKGLPSKGSPEHEEFEKVRKQFTRFKKNEKVQILATWNSPTFFKALAAAEREHDVKRHEVLFHEYAERFRVHSDIVFTLVMDSDSFDLFEYSVKENVLLRNDKGDEAKPLMWSKLTSFSPQHLEGILYFPQRNKAGTLMMGHLTGEHIPGERPPIFIELVIQKLQGNQEMVLQWEVP
ncbi:MAG TPA: hypothetical protein VGB26_00690 [Nitrospiria bacterium]|jgi:hypothetical protein